MLLILISVRRWSKKELRGIDVPVPNACLDQYSEITPMDEYHIDFSDDRLIYDVAADAPGHVEQPIRNAEIGHIVLDDFPSGSVISFAGSLDVLYTEGLAGAVIDVRGNGGGFLSEALDAVSLFVALTMPEKTLLTIEDEQGSKCYKVPGPNVVLSELKCMLISPFARIDTPRPPIDFMTDLPVVVLVDRKTASAAEIFAGILQRLGKPIVGETTYGKGVGQDIVLKGELVLEFTTFEYFIGEDTKVDGVGITPDHYVVDDPSTDTDEALERAIAIATLEVLMQ